MDITTTYAPRPIKDSVSPAPLRVNTTRMMVSEAGGPFRVINTITSGSSFRGYKRSGDLNTFEEQMLLAKDQAYGWRQNGPFNEPTFLVVQFKPTRDGKFAVHNSETM